MIGHPAIRNPQSAIRNPQSAIRNPQSAIRIPHSPLPNLTSTLSAGIIVSL
jgi:major type 1 subunit fimbrin (pilin)